MNLKHCPCGSNRPYVECCGALHAGLRNAASAEELMRSRYTAYAMKLPDYIVATTLPASRADDLMQQVEAWMQETTWLGLEVMKTSGGTATDTTGEVEFRAHYTVAGVQTSHHEHSRFEKYEGEWHYKEGTVEN